MEQHPSGIVLLIGPPEAVNLVGRGILGSRQLVGKTSIDLLPDLTSYPSTLVHLPNRPTASFREFNWDLDTKYYTASLRLWILEAKEFSAGSAPLLRALGSTIKNSVEGVLLAFDAGTPGSFELAAMWADLLGAVKEAGATATAIIPESTENDLQVDSNHGFGLQFLVSVNTHQPSAHAEEEKRAQWIKWGLDRAYELVEVPPSLDVAALRDEFREREKSGLARVCEAAEANRWSTLALKSRSRSIGSSNADPPCSERDDSRDFREHDGHPPLAVSPQLTCPPPSEVKGVVLLVGPSQQKSALAAGLLGFHSVVATSSASSCLSPLSSYPSNPVVLRDQPGASFREYSWHLDTKYYTAPLRLWVIEEECFRNDGLVEGGQLVPALGHEICTQVEGVVLAFDAGGEESFAAVKSWVEHLATAGRGRETREIQESDNGCVPAGASEVDSAGGEEAVDVRAPTNGSGDDGLSNNAFGLQLLVSMSTGQGVGVEPEEATRVQRLEWGLDRAYELVDVSTCSEVSVLRDEFMEREKSGLARVCEAAEANRWSTLVMKDPCKSSSSGRGSRGKGGDGAQGTSSAALSPPAAVASASPREASAPTSEQGATQGGPSGRTFVAGDRVVVVGLASAAHHNGSRGTVLRFDETKGRFVVRLQQPEAKGKRATVLAIKAGNLGVDDSVKQVERPGQLESAMLLEEEGSSAGSIDKQGDLHQESSADAPEAAPSDKSLESDMRSFEGLVEEVKQARENTGKMSDDERRAKAASTALKLLASLGDDGDSSSDEE